ncbi:hypothetical protein GCM10027068_42090 [Prescottella soli]
MFRTCDLCEPLVDQGDAVVVHGRDRPDAAQIREISGTSRFERIMSPLVGIAYDLDPRGWTVPGFASRRGESDPVTERARRRCADRVHLELQFCGSARPCTSSE